MSGIVLLRRENGHDSYRGACAVMLSYSLERGKLEKSAQFMQSARLGTNLGRR
jgi:hypothetical protein